MNHFQSFEKKIHFGFSLFFVVKFVSQKRRIFCFGNDQFIGRNFAIFSKEKSFGILFQREQKKLLLIFG